MHLLVVCFLLSTKLFSSEYFFAGKKTIHDPLVNSPSYESGKSYASFNINQLKSDEKIRVLFIFDYSFSMYSGWSSATRIESARRLMGEVMDSIRSIPNLELALRCYGHQTPYRPVRNCEDSKLEIPFASAKENAEKIKQKINRLEPTGTTPIAYSIGQSANDFPPCDGCRNIIILITDGLEECGGDPCAVSLALQKNKVFLRPFVIGLGLDVKFADAFACMGKFYDVSNEANFHGVMKMVLTEALTQTTVQVDLLTINKKPLETDVTLSFYNQYSNSLEYNFLHTLNHKGNPDTLSVNPEIQYKIVVHTIPPVVVENVNIEKGKHNTIRIDAPQGNLMVKVNGVSLYGKIKMLVRKSSETQTINVQETGNTEKYLVGKYELEILTLPRIILKEVEIKQSTTNLITIPSAGELFILKGTEGYGSIYLEENKKLIWVANLNPETKDETIYLQPGNYRAEFRRKFEQDSDKTIEKKFTIKSEQKTSIKF